MLPQVQLLDEMDESMWVLFWKNLTGITDAELDWRPHPDANSTRWIVGHLTWFEEWAHDAIAGVGRYATDAGPNAYLDGGYTSVRKRFEAARARYRERIAELTVADLDRKVTYLKRYEVSILDLLKTHALHLAGHRFQIRYIRGAYSRAHGTPKHEFDPW